MHSGDTKRPPALVRQIHDELAKNISVLVRLLNEVQMQLETLQTSCDHAPIILTAATGEKCRKWPA